MGAIAGSLFKIVEYTLKLTNTKESRKYLDRVLYLKKVYYNEENKPEESRNHAFMDNAINELCVITETVASFEKPIS